MRWKVYKSLATLVSANRTCNKSLRNEKACQLVVRVLDRCASPSFTNRLSSQFFLLHSRLETYIEVWYSLSPAAIKLLETLRMLILFSTTKNTSLISLSVVSVTQKMMCYIKLRFLRILFSMHDTTAHQAIKSNKMAALCGKKTVWSGLAPPLTQE